MAHEPCFKETNDSLWFDSGSGKTSINKSVLKKEYNYLHLILTGKKEPHRVYMKISFSVTF